MLNGKVYRWEGNKHQSTLVCLHGFLGSGSDFQILADFYVNHPPLLAPSFPDYSECSIVPDLNWPIALHALHSLLLRETGGNTFDLLGYSMGGRIALQYALNFPEQVRSLILIGSTPGIAEEHGRKERCRADKELADRLREGSLETFLDSWFNQPLLKTQNRIPEPYRANMMFTRRQNHKATLACYLEKLGTGTMPPVWEKLNHIHMPCLLVTGSEDKKFTSIAKLMTKQIAACSHLSIEGAGHAACFEQPQKFTAQLKRFLNKQ